MAALDSAPVLCVGVCIEENFFFHSILLSSPPFSEGAFSIYIYLHSWVRSKAKHTQKYVYKFNDCQPFLLRKFMIIIFFSLLRIFSSLLVSCYLSSLSQVNIYYIFFSSSFFFVAIPQRLVFASISFPKNNKWAWFSAVAASQEIRLNWRQLAWKCLALFSKL